MLLTADEGTVLFFSMATSFSSAALAADGISSSARMLVGSGYSPDRGAYALDLVRRSRPLRQALGIPVGGAGVSARTPRADALARPRRAGPREPHGRADIPRGGSRRVPAASRHPPRRVRGRPLLRELPGRDRSGLRGGDGRVRGPRAGQLQHHDERAHPRRRRARRSSRRSSASCSGIPAPASLAAHHRRGARVASRSGEEVPE